MANRSGQSRRASRASAPAPENASIAARYIESSALVAALLERDPEALKSLRARTRRITSALTLAEAARAIVRARISGRLTAEQERGVTRDGRVRENAKALGYAIE